MTMQERTIILKCQSCNATFRAGYAPGKSGCYCPRCGGPVSRKSDVVDGRPRGVVTTMVGRRGER